MKGLRRNEDAMKYQSWYLKILPINFKKDHGKNSGEHYKFYGGAYAVVVFWRSGYQ